uniref:C-type lectin domain-containing protein n=1 Tax=Pygocentrus nattereri TaxID=42514 RepID=A0A3B4CME7_PYGNA
MNKQLLLITLLHKTLCIYALRFSCLFYFFLILFTFFDFHSTACRANYTDLVTVYSDEDNTALTNLTNLTSSWMFWIGLNRNQFSVKWSNGDDVTFNNLTGVCGSGSCCAAMKADGSWESLQCTEKRNFMCYKGGNY